MRLAFALLPFLFTGCASFQSTNRDAYQSTPWFSQQNSVGIVDYDAMTTGLPGSPGRGHAGGSMFAEDQARISNSAVEELLTRTIALPRDAKLAAISLNELQNRHYRSMDRLQRDRLAAEPMLEKCKTAPRVRETSLLPSLMLGGGQLTLSALRAAAARCQADLLLVYGSDRESMRRTAFLKPPRTTGRVLVEAILLDVRSGTVPLATSGAATFEFDGDEDERSTADGALRSALEQVGEKVVQFLATAP